jgi:flavin-dependent dehydrogenase
VACLKRWGLLERVPATNCPVVGTIGLDLGEFQLTGNVPPADGVGEMCAPRRTVLDKLLLDAAAEAGAEIREGFAVTGLTFSGTRVSGIQGRAKGGVEATDAARIVIGADGRNSLVARLAGAAEYNARPVLTCVCYAYWRGVAPHIPGIHPLPRRLVISFPTNDGLTVTPIVFPRDELPLVRAGLEHHLLEALGQVPVLAEAFRRGVRVERIRAMGDLPNFFRTPFGEGWALVGDAGYHKDPVLAQGISDAFCSAEWLTEAVHAGLSGARPIGEALAAYQRLRDEHFGPMYDLCVNMAALEPPPADMQALFHTLRDNPVERDRYFGTLGGTVPIPEYYAPENVQRIAAGSTAAV